METHVSSIHPISQNKTKKKKNPTQKIDKTRMWDIFDKEPNTPTSIECIYEQQPDNDLCTACNTILMITEEGFPTCTNTVCGIVYI